MARRLLSKEVKGDEMTTAIEVLETDIRDAEMRLTKLRTARRASVRDARKELEYRIARDQSAIDEIRAEAMAAHA
jgi:hypothetical protein